MLAATLIVLVIGQGRTDASTVALERSMRGVLGPSANLRIESVAADPPDDESAARGSTADGVIELIWADDGTSARIHCYLSRERRFIDRQISFGSAVASPEREALERGRLLGFAVATMFLDATEPERAESAETRPEPPEAAPESAVKPAASPSPASDDDARSAPALVPTAAPATSARSLEFAGIGSTGISGHAGGVGASIGLRLRWVGPLSGRLLLAGRTGNLRQAQASTRTALFGGGLALDFLPERSRLRLGVRLDGFACYFDATHWSEDDVQPALQSRWLGGSDLVAEAGFRFNETLGAFVGSGLEAIFGRTDVYTHGNRVAVVPLLRIVGELGLRTHF